MADLEGGNISGSEEDKGFVGRLFFVLWATC